LAPKRFITAAGTFEVRLPLLRFQLAGEMIKALDFVPPFGHHGPSLLWLV
jgi:hypothetical protein